MKLKKMIPNILTSLRILVIPFIVYLGLYEKYKALAILVAVISLTDFFDGYLARKFNAVSKLGALLDTFGDKLFAISFLILLILKRKIFIPLLVLEILIAIVNLVAYHKTHIANTRFIGKIKTWSLSVSGILGTINLFFPKIHVLMDFFIVLTIILQLITLLLYSKDLADISKKKNFEVLKKEHYEIIKDIINHPEFQKRKKFEHHYNESVFDHCYRVSFDCFYVAKLLRWKNIKNVAIAGILHDFYDKPWQDVGPKKKFLEKHGFVHAKEALDNSRKYFKEHLNRKIENSILRHMFPLNKVPPRYKEGWLIVIVDKIDSMDFLLHPSLLKKCISNKTKK